MTLPVVTTNMQTQDSAIEAAKAVPPVTVVGTHLAGVSLNDWVLYGSALLIVLQIFFLLKKQLWDKKKD
jgi:hypothetical protein